MKWAAGLSIVAVSVFSPVAKVCRGQVLHPGSGSHARAQRLHNPSIRHRRMAQLFVSEDSRPAPADPAQEHSPMPTLESYWKALEGIQSEFYNPNVGPRPDDTHLTYAAIRGVLGSLNDPYTRFLAPAQYSEMQNENRGTFPGIGVELRAQGGKVLIMSVVPESPAAEAPILPGDQVLRVNSIKVDSTNAENVGDLLKGEEGTRVTLVIERAGKTLIFSLTRKEVSYPHFSFRIVDGDVGYMRLTMFDEQAGENIHKAMQAFSHDNVKGLILDLRDNPGGLLNSAVDVASQFMPPGPVVWVQERGGQRNSLPTTSNAPMHGVPLVVLVNHFSASASEIVSGAMQDTHAGTVVGVTTWGKGLVQEIIPLNDSSALALTTAHYFTPNGSDINLKGVTPDITAGHTVQEPDEDTPTADETYNREKSRIEAEQLQRGLAVIRQKLADAHKAAAAHHAAAPRIARKP